MTVETIMKEYKSFDHTKNIYYVNVYPNRYGRGVMYGFMYKTRKECNTNRATDCLYRIVIRRK